MHSEEKRCDEGQVLVFKHTLLACVHEQAGNGAVQTHVDNMETERCHTAQQDVQPDTGRKKTSALWDEQRRLEILKQIK